MNQLARFLAVGAMTAGVAGCAMLPHAHHLVAVRPIPLSKLPQGSREDGYYASAKVAIERRDYARALDLLQAASAIKPKDARILNAFGVVYDKLGRFDLSERYYAQAEALDPASAIVASNRAWSAALRARSGASALAPAGGVTTAAPAVVAVAPPLAAPGPLARQPVIELAAAGARSTSPALRLLGHPLALVDASGRKGGAAPVAQGLVRLGWTPPTVQAARAPRKASFISYPAHSERVARSLARSLPRRVQLVSCGLACQDVRLVLGTDSVGWAFAGRGWKVRSQ